MFNDKNTFQRSNSKLAPYIPTPKNESGSPIRSNQEQKSLLINVPNYSAYSQGQNNEDEKVLINKAELISFAQSFAQQKINLENTVQNLTKDNRMITAELQKIRRENAKIVQQNQRLKQQNEKHKQQNERLRTINEFKEDQNATHYYEAIESLKVKLKQQFEKRLHAEREMHGMEAVVFEHKKKNQFLTDKMKHQEDQMQRCDQLLRIKEDIIQNLEWDKANATYHQRTVPSINTYEKNLLQKPSAHNINQTGPKQSSSLRIDRRELQINETLNLSGINIHQQSEMTNQQCSLRENNPAKKKFIICKKPSESDTVGKRGPEQDDKKKLNVSVYKKSNSQSDHDKQTSTEKGPNEKSKPKGIVLKKRLNTSTFIEGPDLNQKEQVYLEMISRLQHQNEQLKTEMRQMSELNVSSFGQSNTLMPSEQNSQFNKESSYKLLQKKYNLMRQKCLLLEGQIQKTIRKYIIAQERSSQLQKMIQSSPSSSVCRNEARNQTERQGPICIQVQRQVARPGLSLEDLVTPQFRQSKLGNKFFTKKNSENQWNQSQFNQISIQDYKMRTGSHLFDTFDRNGNVSQMSNIIEREEVQRSYERNDLSRQFNEIEDVSEIVCNNEEDLAIEDTMIL